MRCRTFKPGGGAGGFFFSDVPSDAAEAPVSYPCRVMHCLELSIQLPLSMARKYRERAHRIALETQ